MSLVVLTGVVIVGKVVGVSVGAFLTGGGIRTSVQTGMSLAQIGEFSFIIAGLGISLHATRDFLYPVAIAVSAVTTLTTPWLIRSAGPVATFIDRKLPRPIQTYAALYGTWVEQLRAPREEKDAATSVARLFKLLLLDVVILAALVIGAALSTDGIAQYASRKVGLSLGWVKLLVILTAIALALPLVAGIFRIAGGLGLALAQAAMPAPAMGKVDLADAPRRALVITLQLAVMLLVGLPILALIQPFLPGWIAAPGLVTLLVLFGFVFWRSATNLEGHVKAGAEMIVEALLTQAGKPSTTPDHDALGQIKHLMPGLGEPVPARLDESSAAVGKTLAQLNLRGLTGASVLAIARGEEGVIVPTASEVLRAGDVLALAGTKDAVTAALDMLKGVGPADV